MLTWGIRKLSTCRPQARALFKPAAALRTAALFSAATGSTTACGALSVGADIAAVLLNLALLAQLSIAPALRVSHNQVHAFHAGSRHLLLGILRLGAHTDGEQSEVRETHALAVENQLLQMVRGRLPK